ncbi:MAG: hypothetical protein AAFZ15_28135 [Bacteroidota bacterium]
MTTHIIEKQNKAIQIGTSKGQFEAVAVSGDYVKIGNEDFYKISNYDQMAPFFMSIVSGSDHWLFISSNGGLTAGRKNPQTALFPYYTDDKIHDSHETTGSKTIVRATIDDKVFLWEPFSDRYEGIYEISRNLYKNVSGNQLIFEESNENLGLQFNYGWYNSDEFGIVRKAWIKNVSQKEVMVDILDGFQNILPYGVPQFTQANLSTLVDAYKKNELDPDTGLGMYMLSSIIVDRAEPSEALACNTVWSCGLEGATRFLCSKQLSNFRKGLPVHEETDIRAERGGYFLNKKIDLAPSGGKTWYLVAEVKQSSADVAKLISLLGQKEGLPEKLEADIKEGTARLDRLVANSDGLQKTADQSMTARHFSNVMYNIMRGGVFVDNFKVQRDDFVAFATQFNQHIVADQSSFFESLHESFKYGSLIEQAADNGDPNLLRIAYEYLPLIFSRRHGDPSRPWNKFTIDVKNEDGTDNLYYAGNWRDIFQNWEALAYSYPGFTESMIAKFVNASTADGYNPYRITREGIDWEVVEPDDPWSYIGYWGDHQIIYLQKLMEVSDRHHPGRLRNMLTQPIFAYANVPYRIKPYQAQLVNPFDTVDFDDDLEAKIAELVGENGSDGKLLFDQNGSTYLVNFTEKLLVSVLAKFSNFIPEGGIWLNTQRPEWNDANNALVGNGVSMVTLYYMRRFQSFCLRLFSGANAGEYEVSVEVANLFRSINNTFKEFQGLLAGAISDEDRKTILDQLGNAGSSYRWSIYENGFSGEKNSVSKTELISFIELSIKYIDHSIRANKRADGLYHAYNLMSVKNENEISISYLYEMLEGQVAVLSSGYLAPEESVEVLKALRNSSIYREDQNSYVLYPDRELPRFLEKNNIPESFSNRSDLFAKLIANNNRDLVEKDVDGIFHFSHSIRNANDLKEILNQLKTKGYKTLIEKEKTGILDVFEKMFDHQSFTGRSGTFYGYEGLGSIYWHMVSKLLLAAEEVYLSAVEEGAEATLVQQLSDCYYDIRGGIGFNKSPEEYGAFPSDAYSHTPGNAGAQQPGMTGQVKEDVLARFGELGVFVEEGKITFRPTLLNKKEFLSDHDVFSYFNVFGEKLDIELTPGSLAFTYCQVPVIYRIAETNGVVISKNDGQEIRTDELTIGGGESSHIFSRSGEIARVEVQLNI